MKASLIILAFLFSAFSMVNAQFKVLGEGPMFEEPEEGSVKVVQLPNGNTMFLHFWIKRHFKVLFTLYSSKYKVINEGSFALKNPDKETSVGNPTVISNDILLPLYTFVNYKYNTVRIVIDGIKGTIKAVEDKPDLVETLPGISKSSEFLDKVFPTKVRLKDINGGSYSIIDFGMNKSKVNSINIETFDTTDKKIREKHYPIPETNFKFNDLISIEHISDNKLGFLLNEYNLDKKKKKAGKSFLVIIDLTENATFYPLDTKEDMISATCYTAFNPVTNQILIHSVFEKNPAEEEFNSYLSAFSIPDKKFIYSTQINIEEIVKKSEDEFGKKDGRINAPQDIFINNTDGSFKILFERVNIEENEYRNYSVSGNLHYTAIHTRLGNIAALSFDKNGKEIGSCIIPKSQLAQGEPISYFHSIDLNNSFQQLGKGNQFKIYSYFNKTGKPFLFINDVPENTESAKKGKLTTIYGIKDGNAYYYELSQNGILTTRKYLFGEPEKNHNNYLCLFSASDYDEKRNIMVTLKVKPDGKDRGMQLVWLQPD